MIILNNRFILFYLFLSAEDKHNFIHIKLCVDVFDRYGV